MRQVVIIDFTTYRKERRYEPRKVYWHGRSPKFAAPGGDTSLMKAAWNCKLGVAKALLSHGAPANAANVNGETALIFASQTCPDGRMVQLLLSAGADPNAKENDGATALMAADDNPLVVEKLLTAGADPSVKDKVRRYGGK